MRTAQRLGYRTVAVYSDADRDAPHVTFADEAIRIGPASARESYLNIPALLVAAGRSRAQAVHPGYGFLSENPEFAQACVDAGLVFVGPSVAAIRLMGNKRLARECIGRAGVPCVPGYEGAGQEPAALLAEAQRIGFPIMIKAAAGGGGRGMRRVEAPDNFVDALAQARAEARSAFGGDEMLLERALTGVRHVEVQVFGDTHGNVVHLGERDCSVQRRHQKVIEEAPSPAVDNELRRRLGDAAVVCARAIEYVGAGTVEFLLDARRQFYFMEMNTRLQVEHPVTECITGLDLVEWQLRVADGEPLPLMQDEITWSGHAIEARLYAEDPAAGHRPQTGRIERWAPASGAGVRVDAGIRAGQEITPYYDSMLAKVIAHGRDRREALRRLIRALEDTVVFGVTTNREFLAGILRDEVFERGEATTTFLAERAIDVSLDPETLQTATALAAILLSGERLRGWRSTGVPSWPLRLQRENEEPAVAAITQQGERFEVRFAAGDSVAIELPARGDAIDTSDMHYLRDGYMRRARYAWLGDARLAIDVEGHSGVYQALGFSERRDAIATDSLLVAPMSGKVVEVRVTPGVEIAKGQVLVVLESMKMYHQLVAARSGRVAQVFVRAGQQVDSYARLVELEPK